jgi:hypothetical protein
MRVVSAQTAAVSTAAGETDAKRHEHASAAARYS